jgi:beta-lactamase regulating signal transducer with metallopeptidase domain
VWQGAALAVLLYSVMAVSRSALVRYTAAVSTLALMAICPVVTFLVLEHQPASTFPAPAIKQSLQAVESLGTPAFPFTLPTAVSVSSIDWLSCFVWLWFLGVLVFGIRALGGWLLLERLRREKCEPVERALREQWLALQARLGLSRSVRYFQSRLVDAPAVLGWFRPIVVVPVAALTGLSPQQLEAVIVHELAHIKRLDCFVNLFQIAVETLLFYHPAVWWVSRAIRTERENCCDDVAVALCGNVGDYARALTLMETWRAAPALILAANSGSLRSRISRLLGVRDITRSVPGGGLAAVGLLCAGGALLAAASFPRSISFTADVTSPAPEIQKIPTPAEAPPPAPPAPSSASAPSAPTAAPVPPAKPAKSVSEDEQIAPQPPSSSGSYIEGIQAAGLKNLTVDELIQLKIQGVTPQYIRDMRATGLNPSVRELISMRAVGVTPEYVSKVHSAGWNDVTVRELISMKAQGIDPGDAGQYRQLGLKDLTLRGLISLKAMGVTPDYIRALQSLGLTNLSTRDYVSAKAQGITPEFVQKVRSHGFNNLTIHQLIGLKMADVF